MFTIISAIVFQTQLVLLSSEKNRQALKALKDFGLSTFSLTGQLPIDMAIFGSLCITAVILFAWVFPPKRHLYAEGIPGGEISQQISRRELFVASGFVGAIAAGGAVFSFLPTPSRSLAFWSREAIRILRLRIRRIRKAKYHFFYSGQPGWYQYTKTRGILLSRLSETDRKATSAPPTRKLDYWVAHFVAPEYRLDRRSKKWPIKNIFRTSGHIAGTGKLSEELLTPLDPSSLPPLLDREKTLIPPEKANRLNRQHYSEGIEFIAIRHWKSGSPDLAIAALIIGITYAEARSPLNLRLHDLLAGLLTRGHRDAELSVLIERIKGLESTISVRGTKEARRDAARLKSRQKSWSSPRGLWRIRWLAPTHSWNGVDI